MDNINNLKDEIAMVLRAADIWFPRDECIALKNIIYSREDHMFTEDKLRQENEQLKQELETYKIRTGE